MSTNPLAPLGILDFAVNLLLRVRVVTGQCSSCIVHNRSFHFTPHSHVVSRHEHQQQRDQAAQLIVALSE